MTANAADFAGSGCGRRYEKELETHFRDCLLFYLAFALSGTATARLPASCSAYGPMALTQTAIFCGTENRNLTASAPPFPAA